MRELSLFIAADNRPLYLRIAETLRNAIQNGQLKPGERIPSSRTLAVMLDVHRNTVIAATDELIAEGWLEGGARRAHRVCAVLPSNFFTPKAIRKATPCFQKPTWRFVRQVQRFNNLPEDESSYRYAFPGGVPDLRLFPYEEFRACVTETLRESPPTIGGYSNPAGHPEFIKQLSLYLRRTRAIMDRRIIVTHGAQESLFLVAQLLIGTGDKVAVDELGFPPAWDAFRAAGGELVPIKMDKNGAVPEALEAAICKHGIRLIYLTPHHQYPTTVTLSTARRLRIYELASQHEIPIIEDDYDHEFHYRSRPIAPLASTDPCGLVIYISTLSKITLPSMRLGFLAVPESLYDPLVNLHAVITRQNNVFIQDAVARWMANGGFERHLKRMRRMYHERRDVLVAELDAGRSSGLPLNWSVPDGGIALWLDCGVNTDVVAREAMALQVFVSPESVYRLRASRYASHLRLGYANQTPEEIHAGMSVLRQAIESVNSPRQRKATRAAVHSL